VATGTLTPLGMIQTPTTMGRAIPIIETKIDPNIIDSSSDTAELPNQTSHDFVIIAYTIW
jgi:hypothetical protein